SNGEEPIHIDAESLNMFDVLDAGPDRLANDGSVQEEPNAGINEQGDDDNDQAVDRDLRAENVDLGSDRNGHWTRHQPPEIFDHTHAADQNPEGCDHTEGDISFVDASVNEAFHGEARDAPDDRSTEHAEPQVSYRQADGIGDVRTDGVIEQLVEADDAHQAKTQGKPD